MTPLKAPFPWFGGKSRAAPLIWQALGDVRNYVEPFAGSLAVLLGRPSAPQVETINDKDGFVCNFWRALANDPEQVAHYADWPANENDLHARHAWLVQQRDQLTARLEGDPDYAEPRIAGWWVWGLSLWIGGGWCSGEGPWHQVDGQLLRLGDAGRGVHRRLLHLGSAGRGVHRPRLHLGCAGRGVHRPRLDLGCSGRVVHRPRLHLGDNNLCDYFAALAQRLTRVRVSCGDWTRILSPAVTTTNGMTGMVLDPPYEQATRSKVYAVESDVSGDVRAWALAHGEDPMLRIVLCGYEGEEMPETWQTIAWKATGVYGNQAAGRGRANAYRERLWLSPACLTVGGAT